MRDSIKLAATIKPREGFTLVEASIALLILGLVIGMGLVALGGVLRYQSEKGTFKRMEQIADAISLYAQTHMRVPCPADPRLTPPGGEPYGAERGSDDATAALNGANIGSCDNNSAEGIVPFVTLGIPRELIYDKFGNYFTYRVSVTSTLDPRLIRAQNVSVNHWFRTEPFWHVEIDLNNDGDTGDANEEYKDNMEKAAFCGGTYNAGGAVVDTRPATDVILKGPYGDLTDIKRINNYGGAEIEYGSPNSAAAASRVNLNNTFPPIFPAYVLVSHGENGVGAYGGNVANHAAAPAGPEQENADGDNEFYVSDRVNPAVSAGAGFETTLFRPDLDDIVFWETPAQSLNRLGEVSCSRP